MSASGGSIWLTVLACAVFAGVLFLIPVLIELRRAVRSLHAVLQITEQSLSPTLRDLRATLANLDRITSDISTVTDDVRVFTKSVRQVGRDVEELSGLITVIGSGLGAKISGLRAGLAAGSTFFAKNLFKKGGHQ